MNMNRRRTLIIFAVVLAVLGSVLAIRDFTRPTTSPPAVRKIAPAKAQKPAVKAAPKPVSPAPVQLQVVQPAPATRIDIDVSTPAGSRVKVNVVEENATRVAPTPMPPAPIPQPAPAPSVQTPVPPTTPPAPPQALFQAPSASVPQGDIQAAARPPAKTVNILSGNSIQFRVEIASRWGGTYGYGSTYGWTPGHMATVCEDRDGDGYAETCFRRWIAHPQPGY